MDWLACRQFHDPSSMQLGGHPQRGRGARAPDCVRQRCPPYSWRGAAGRSKEGRCGCRLAPVGGRLAFRAQLLTENRRRSRPPGAAGVVGYWCRSLFVRRATSVHRAALRRRRPTTFTAATVRGSGRAHQLASLARGAGRAFNSVVLVLVNFRVTTCGRSHVLIHSNILMFRVNPPPAYTLSARVKGTGCSVYRVSGRWRTRSRRCSPAAAAVLAFTCRTWPTRRCT